MPKTKKLTSKEIEQVKNALLNTKSRLQMMFHDKSDIFTEIEKALTILQ